MDGRRLLDRPDDASRLGPDDLHARYRLLAGLRRRPRIDLFRVCTATAQPEPPARRRQTEYDSGHTSPWQIRTLGSSPERQGLRPPMDQGTDDSFRITSRNSCILNSLSVCLSVQLDPDPKPSRLHQIFINAFSET